ncbi:globin domain-containing protein [Melissospora conviva]|uniref:globin domain-containing protein n=1 Tax=Melissospora conviva TaxID=3388432 RepID=UPI003C278119
MDNLERLLKESWVLVEDSRDRLVSHFYSRLFLDQPGLRNLFPAQMAPQHDRLLEALVTTIQIVGDPERFDTTLRALGRDHRRFHLRDEHFDAVGEALLDALASVAGKHWNDEYQQAWAGVYAAIADRMRAGAAEATEPAFWNAEVLTHERRGRDLAVITCRPLLDRLDYRAGQHVSVEVPRFLPRVWRTYAIANAPTDDNVLEFHVRVPRESWVSAALVRRTKPGHLLRLAAPTGAMTLNRDSSRDILCVAGGVGIAPIKALVQEVARYNRTRWVHVFYGARRRDDLYGLAEFQQLLSDYPWLSVVPVCSKDPDFTGEQGQVSEVFTRFGPWTEHDCFVAGSGPMVRATLGALAADGVPPEQIRYDSFGDY